MELLALKALKNKVPQFGVKGPSMLSKLSHFDVVDGFVPDFLHCSLLGVARQLVSLWFDSNNHDVNGTLDSHSNIQSMTIT